MIPPNMPDSDINFQEQSSTVLEDAVDAEISDTDDFFESPQLESEEGQRRN